MRRGSWRLGERLHGAEGEQHVARWRRGSYGLVCRAGSILRREPARDRRYGGDARDVWGPERDDPYVFLPASLPAMIMYVNVSKVDSRVSVYLFRKVDESPYWTNLDVCGYTHMTWTWPVPSDFKGPDGAQYWLSATNVTMDDNVANGTVMATSGMFAVLPSNPTTTTTATSSATPGSTETLPPTPPSGLTSGSGLSAGAKAGIGIGVVLAAALLALIGWFLWRRRQASGTSGGERFEKAELGADAEIPPKEAGGNEILEMDAEEAQRQALQQHGPAELHGDTIHPAGTQGDATVVQDGAENQGTTGQGISHERS